MKTTTQAAYDAGVRAALAMAEAVAEGIAAHPAPGIRHEAAVLALRGLAEEGRLLLTSQPVSDLISTGHDPQSSA